MSVQWSVLGTAGFIFLLANCQELRGQMERSDFVSVASFVVGTHEPPSRDHSPESMTAAASAFIESLDESQRERLLHPLDSGERREWTNLPPRPDAGGLRLGLLDEKQVRAACNLMATLLSEQGYSKICHIMLADDQLLPEGRPRSGIGTVDFALVIFGEPSASEPWAFQVDGHHLGVNIAIRGDQVSLSPSFIGTQPESFTLGKDPIRPLGDEIDGGYALAASLSDDQRRQAVVNDRRGQIVTGPGADGRVPDSAGLSFKEMNDAQHKMALKLIACWVNNLPEPCASRRMEQIESELDETRFSWNGGLETGSDVSWRIQGPSVIIEFACQAMGGNPLDHLHTMYRDPTNEYGGQLDN